jgi:hypothetical protein
MKASTGIATVVAAGVIVAGCGTASTPDTSNAAPSASSSVTASAQPSASSTPTAPDSAAAAKSAAETYFGLYAAGQYGAVYPMIAPAARRYIRESVWVGLHNRCRPSATATLSYKVTHPILAGTVAVVTVGYAGTAAALGSEQITFKYVGGNWYYQPSDLGVYRHHDLAQAVTAAKAGGIC